MSQRNRISKLEQMRSTKTSHKGIGGIQTPKWWVATFARLEREGVFAAEPDAELAIRLHREAVERGHETTEWEWVGEMYSRISKGKPPVTEAEYDELRTWYLKHEKTGGIYDVNIRDALINRYSRGPRRMGTTQTVEKLRALRAEYPDFP
jgi:hypothetical protein